MVVFPVNILQCSNNTIVLIASKYRSPRWSITKSGYVVSLECCVRCADPVCNSNHQQLAAAIINSTSTIVLLYRTGRNKGNLRRRRSHPQSILRAFHCSLKR